MVLTDKMLSPKGKRPSEIFPFRENSFWPGPDGPVSIARMKPTPGLSGIAAFGVAILVYAGGLAPVARAASEPRPLPAS